MNAAADTVGDEKPRMTAADADARFAALLAEHRAGKRSGGPAASPARTDDRRGALAFVLVFCLGVAAGAIFHAKPLLAVVLGAPTIFIARHLWLRSRDRRSA